MDFKQYVNEYFSDDAIKQIGNGQMRAVYNRQNSCLILNNVPVDLLFIGDSITEGFELQVYFKKFGMVINRGIGGEGVIDLIKRFKHDVVNLKPKVCFMCEGVNNIGYTFGQKKQAGETITSEFIDQFTLSLIPYYKQAIDMCRENGIKLIIGSCLPLGIIDERTDAIILLNKRIKELCKENNVEFVDTFSKLTESDGKTLIQCTNGDLLHLLGHGYNIYAETLMPYLEKAFENN